MILDYSDVPAVTILGSQKGQDNLINYTFQKIGTTNKYYVDFGACDGWHFSNVSFLREYQGWTGLLLEGDPSWGESEALNLHTESLTRENILELLEKYGVPE